MMKKNNKGLYYCPHCRAYSMRIDDKHGYYVCTACGIVNPIPIYDQTSEYRNFAVEHGVKDRSRSSYSGDSTGESLGTSVQRTGSKESKLLYEATQKFTTDKEATKLRKNLRCIQELTNSLNLSKEIQRDAQEYFKKQQDENLLPKNARKEAIYAVCVYFACIKNKQSKRKEDIIKEVSDVTSKDFSNVLKHMEPIKPGNILASELARNDAKTLGFKPYIQEAIYAIGQKAEEQSLFTGKTPDSVAAALIAFVNQHLPSDLQIPLTNIFHLIGVAETTVQNHLKVLSKELNVMAIPQFKSLLDQLEKK